MSEIKFEEYLDKEGDYAYRTRKKFPSGMTAEFGFWFYKAKGWGGDVHPYFTIYRKKRDFWPEDRRATTGRDGLAPAMWALECLEEASKVRERSDFTRVIVYWEDNRRRDIYTRVLAKRGFQRTFHNGKECLMRLTRPQN